MDNNDVGVVIGRFQVETLHEGHRYLINEAFRHHKKVIIFVGCSPILGTKYDPLDFPTRERMLRAEYPDAIILPQYDRLSDEEWSKTLDTQIRGIVPNLTGAKLYGGRGSFQPHYKGEFTVVEVNSGIEYRSGTMQRSDIGKVVRSSPDFRAGVIYSTQNAFPYVKACVDVACIRKVEKKVEVSNVAPYQDQKMTIGQVETQVLLGRKASENKWRLPGGMVDKGETLEQAASREFNEETGLTAELSKLRYIGSFSVSDWRFKNAGEIGLLTSLFVVDHTWGAPKANDDLVELKWCEISLAEDEVVKGHKTLIAALRRNLNA